MDKSSLTTLLLALVLTATAVTGCEPYERMVDGIVAPNLRERPVQLLHISGEKDSALDIEMNVVYATAKKACMRTVNWLEGAKADRRYTVNYPVRSTVNSFEVTVELDKLEPGLCRWVPFSINYTVKKNGKPHTSPIPPTPLFWIHEPFLTEFPSFDVECSERVLNGMQGLFCFPPLGKYFISPNIKVLMVNFHERTWSGMPTKRLGELK